MRAPPTPLVTRVLVTGLLVAVAASPVALAQSLGLGEKGSGGASGGGLPEAGGFDSGGLLDGLSLSVPLAIGITVAIGAVVAAIAFMGGTKFVNSENVLENDARRMIFEHIRQHPGAHLRATATALNLSTTNVLWHLRKLEGANLVASKKFEGYKLFYPVEGGLESRKRAIAHSVIRNENAQQILEYVLGRPSAHQREIARALGVNHGTIRWHLRKLADANLLLPIKKESQTSYYVSELGVQLLGELGNARAQAHVSGLERAPGAAVPASIAVPMQTAHAVMPQGAALAGGALAGTAPPRYAPQEDDDE